MDKFSTYLVDGHRYLGLSWPSIHFEVLFKSLAKVEVRRIQDIDMNKRFLRDMSRYFIDGQREAVTIRIHDEDIHQISFGSKDFSVHVELRNTRVDGMLVKNALLGLDKNSIVNNMTILDNALIWCPRDPNHEYYPGAKIEFIGLVGNANVNFLGDEIKTIHKDTLLTVKTHHQRTVVSHEPIKFRFWDDSDEGIIFTYFRELQGIFPTARFLSKGDNMCQNVIFLPGRNTQ